MSCSAAFVVGCPSRESIARRSPPNWTGSVIAERR
jgi:hypothetical protein